MGLAGFAKRGLSSRIESCSTVRSAERNSQELALAGPHVGWRIRRRGAAWGQSSVSCIRRVGSSTAHHPDRFDWYIAQARSHSTAIDNILDSCVTHRCLILFFSGCLNLSCCLRTYRWSRAASTNSTFYLLLAGVILVLAPYERTYRTYILHVS